MGAVLTYSLISSIYLIAGWGVYRLLLADKKLLRFNRCVILGIYILSLLAFPLANLVRRIFSYTPQEDVLVNVRIPVEIFTSQVMTRETPVWILVLAGAYFLGMVVVAVYSLMGIAQLCRIIKNSEVIKGEGYTLVKTSVKIPTPFSWGHFIVIREDEDMESLPLIISHELAHLRRRHWLDLLLAQAVCIFEWYNPAAWRLRAELAMIHEYEADADVVAEGEDEREYQYLLLRRSCSANQKILLANNLNTNHLKKRIAMMKRTNSKLGVRWRALAFLPALALAFWVTQTPAVASVVEETSDVSLPVLLPGESWTSNQSAHQAAGEIKADAAEVQSENKNEEVHAAVDVLPEYPGGVQAMYDWLSAHIQFPASLIADDITGRVIVKFVVDKNGKVKDPVIMKGLTPEADEEAKRVVLEMPKWNPGTVDGKPVDCSFVLPVSFKFEKDEAEESKERKIVLRGSNGGVTAELPVQDGHEESSSVAVNGKILTVTGDGVKSNFDPSKKDAPEIFVNDKPLTGSLSDIDPSDIASMLVEKGKDGQRDRIYVTLKK